MIDIPQLVSYSLFSEAPGRSVARSPYITGIYTQGPEPPRPAPESDRERDLQADGGRPLPRDGLEGVLLRGAARQPRPDGHRRRHPHLPRVLPLNPMGFGGLLLGPHLQHRHILRDQHQPPALQRRDDPLLPQPDVGDPVPPVHLGRDRHLRGRGDRPAGSPTGRRTWATSTWTLSGRSPGSSSPSVSSPRSSSSGWAVPQTIGGYVTVKTIEGATGSILVRASRLARLDNAAGHQRRRILRRQLGASLS